MDWPDGWSRNSCFITTYKTMIIVIYQFQLIQRLKDFKSMCLDSFLGISPSPRGAKALSLHQI
jgi:hypothetical protein